MRPTPTEINAAEERRAALGRRARGGRPRALPCRPVLIVAINQNCPFFWIFFFGWLLKNLISFSFERIGTLTRACQF